MTNDDTQLLSRFVDEQSQEAFMTLVQRHVGLVYSAALRQVGGDAHLAWDASQGVFLALAQTAPRLLHHSSIVAWLYTTTRFVSTKLVRTRRRARAREEQVAAMTLMERESAGEPDWAEVRPLLDDAMHELSSTDRLALLERYFVGRSFGEIGAAAGLSENAARMRVQRALEKLRTRLALRGVTSTAAALGAGLTAHAVGSAPPALTAALANVAFAGLAASTTGTLGVWGALSFMNAMNMKVGIAAAVVALGVVGYVGVVWPQKRPTNEAAPQPSIHASPANAGPVTTPNAPSANETRRANSDRPPAGPSAPAASGEDRDAMARVSSAAQKALAMSVRSSLDATYGNLFQRFKLPPGELARFRDLLTERQLSSMDAMSAAQSHGLNGVSDPVEMARIMTKVRAEVDTSIRSLLGEQRYGEYQHFNDNAASYALLDLVQRRLSYTPSPLQSAQSDAVLRVLIDSGASAPAPITRDPTGNFLGAVSPGNPFITGSAREPISDATVDRLQNVLAPFQLEVVRQIQSEQRAQADAMRSLAAVGQPGAAPAEGR